MSESLSVRDTHTSDYTADTRREYGFNAKLGAVIWTGGIAAIYWLFKEMRVCVCHLEKKHFYSLFLRRRLLWHLRKNAHRWKEKKKKLKRGPFVQMRKQSRGHTGCQTVLPVPPHFARRGCAQGGWRAWGGASLATRSEEIPQHLFVITQ